MSVNLSLSSAIDLTEDIKIANSLVCNKLEEVSSLLRSIVAEFESPDGSIPDSPIYSSLTKSMGHLDNIKADLKTSYDKTDTFIETQFPDYYSAASALLARFQQIIQDANNLSADIMAICGVEQLNS